MTTGVVAPGGIAGQVAGGESPQVLTTVAVPTFGGLILGNAGGTERGILRQLGFLAALNLNAIAATTIFTTPAAGFSRCIVVEIFADNFSGTPTTNAVSFGASATPTDWLASAVLAAAAAGKGLSFFPANNTIYAVYATAIAFVANVTAGGAAITCDLTAFGLYH